MKRTQTTSKIPMNAKHFLQYESNRKDAYRLLAVCYQLPDEELPKKIAALVTVLDDICSEAVEHITPETHETTIKQLTIDHAKLFVGPFKLLSPPYGSVYLESGRKVMGDSTADANKRYQAAGLKLSPNMKEAPDHITIELEFMYYLIFNEIEALEVSDSERALEFLRTQQAFLREHLGAWVSKFAKNIEENAVTDFYRDLAKVLNTFVVCDQTSIFDVSIATLDSLYVIG